MRLWELQGPVIMAKHVLEHAITGASNVWPGKLGQTLALLW